MTHNAPFKADDLLVSVRSAVEAAQALEAGVRWIDVKEPAAGSLGRPTIDDCRAILAQVSGRSEVRTSVALGELNSLDGEHVRQLMELFSIGKVGMAQGWSPESQWPKLVNQFMQLQADLPSQSCLVPAIYADHQRAISPPPEVVVELARTARSSFVLVDTFLKDGRGLFEWFNPAELCKLRDEVESFDARLVIAGSLRVTDWIHLQRVPDVIVGVRGAVCEDAGDRTSRLSAAKLNLWLRERVAAEEI